MSTTEIDLLTTDAPTARLPSRTPLRLVLVVALGVVLVLPRAFAGHDTALPSSGESSPASLVPRKISMEQFRSVSLRGAVADKLAPEPSIAAEGTATSHEWRVEAATVGGKTCVVALQLRAGAGATTTGCFYRPPVDFGSTTMGKAGELVFGVVTTEAASVELSSSAGTVRVAAVALPQLSGAKGFGALVLPAPVLTVRGLDAAGRTVAEKRLAFSPTYLAGSSSSARE